METEKDSHGFHGLFITGTDTNVGKTVVSAALLHRFRDVARLRYWKPVQSGTAGDDDTQTVRLLAQCAESEILDAGIRLPAPLSPHIAARMEGRSIEIAMLHGLFAAHAGSDALIVEGAGGALVPINERQLMTDLMRELALPVLVVARSTLGTINHTLMTLEALRRRSLQIAGVVMNGAPDPENREAIESFGDVRVLGQLPPLSPLDAKSLRRWAEASLDPEGFLLEFLR
jgi:dethiobiotin synthase